MWHEATGQIVYDPPRPGMKRRTDWWCILKTDSEITRYYRWWVMNRYGIELALPSWDAHISVVRGERPAPATRDLWRKHQNRRMRFRYSHDVVCGAEGEAFSHYWFVRVECPEIRQIRDELGLQTRFPFHLTVGRTYDHQLVPAIGGFPCPSPVRP